MSNYYILLSLVVIIQGYAICRIIKRVDYLNKKCKFHNEILIDIKSNNVKSI